MGKEGVGGKRRKGEQSMCQVLSERGRETSGLPITGAASATHNVTVNIPREKKKKKKKNKIGRRGCSVHKLEHGSDRDWWTPKKNSKKSNS